ncbi:MAG: radical SAM protein [Candidatus Omnitrophota bacterium]
MILINPGYNREQKLGAFSRYVPLSVPMGIGYLAAYLKKHDCKVQIIDEEVTPLSDALLCEYTKNLERPYIFGISALTAGIERAYRVADILKEKYPECKVLFGNVHPTVLPEEVLSHQSVDLVVRGEAEEILTELYYRMKNHQDYQDIKGISFRKNGQIVHNEPSPLPDLKKIPPFPYHLFEQFAGQYDFGFVASSRGCPFNCIFCSQRSISGRQYRFFPADVVVHSMEEIILKYKRSYIGFVDDLFIINKARVFELCEMIRKKGLHKKGMFDCQARGDFVDEEILTTLKASGFRTLHFGIETASERLMKLINKKETVAQVVGGIKLAKKIGLRVSGTFILGLPTETREERRAAYRLAKELSLDYVRFNNATPYPGTELYNIAVKENRLNPGKNWENLNACGTLVESPFKENPLAYVPLGTSERVLRCDILKYNLFYSFRLQSIIKILRERIAAGAWLTLPEKWYFKIEEWIYLIKFAFRILFSFGKVFLYSILTMFER